MYFLEYKELYIVKTELTKNRTHQTYRWKQLAVCEEKQPLEDILKTLDKNNHRIINNLGEV